MRHVLTVIICWTAIHVTYAQQPFEDVTQQAGLEGLSGGVAAWADFDRDGWCDLYVAGQLWRNEQGKRFELVKSFVIRADQIIG